MAEAYVDARDGEVRAAVVDRFRVVQMLVARDGDGLAAGARVAARLTARLGHRGMAEAAGETLLVDPWPSGATEGQTVTLEVTRAAWRERGRDRVARARPTSLAAWPSPSLEALLVARGHVVRTAWPADVAEQWDDSFEQAERGLFRFEGGALNLVPTPAFLAVDVDGPGLSLAGPALMALARVIRLWGLGGSIVIDIPAADRGARTSAAELFDSAMQGLAFERTAINGFGLMQVVRPRPGPSILERAQLDRAGSQAIALLEMARRDRGTGPMRLCASPGPIRWLKVRPHLIEALCATTRRAVDLAADPLLEQPHVETAASP